jgi:ribonuclease R
MKKTFAGADNGGTAMSHDPFQDREAEKYANPIPSREFIIEHLTKREKPANREELAVELNIEGEEQIEALRRRLRAMERDGQLVFTRRQCYALPGRLDLLKGVVIGHRDGYGFLRVEGRKDDLYLSSEQMKMGSTMVRVGTAIFGQRLVRGHLVYSLSSNAGSHCS